MEKKTVPAQASAQAASVLAFVLPGEEAASTAQRHTLSRLLQGATSHLAPATWQMRDTDQGAYIVFLSAPEHAAYAAMLLLRNLQSAAQDNLLGCDQVRMGLHLGPVHQSLGVDARATFVGDGVRTARLLARDAAPGTVGVSRVFRETVLDLHPAMGALFAPLGDGRETHQLDGAAAAFDALEQLALAEPAAPALGSGLKHAAEFVKTWFMPFNAVLVFCGFVLAFLGRLTDQTRAFQIVGVVLLAVAFLIGLTKLLAKLPAVRALWQQHPVFFRTLTSLPVLGLVLAAAGAMFIFAPQRGDTNAGLATAPPALVAPVTTTPPAPAPALAAVTSAAPVPVSASVATAPAEITAAAVPAATAASAAVPARSRSVAPPARVAAMGPSTPAPQPVAAPAAVAQQKGTSPARCALILQKATLDEPVSADERQFLKTSCP